MIAWFCIRGIDSIYYLMHAIDHGLALPLAEQITAITTAAVTVSIVLRSISVRPMMHLSWRRTVPQADYAFCSGSVGRSRSSCDGGLSLVKRRCRFSSCFFFFANAF